MAIHEYILTRLAEDDESILCSQGAHEFELPKDRCRMVQQSYMWDRKLPDTIVIRIPDDIADRLGLIDCEED